MWVVSPAHDTRCALWHRRRRWSLEWLLDGWYTNLIGWLRSDLIKSYYYMLRALASAFASRRFAARLPASASRPSVLPRGLESYSLARRPSEDRITNANTHPPHSSPHHPAPQRIDRPHFLSIFHLTFLCSFPATSAGPPSLPPSIQVATIGRGGPR